MNIQAVTPNFRGNQQSMADVLVNMNDNDLRQLALLKTNEKYDDNKARKITNSLFYTAPLAAGLKTAVFSDGKTKLFSKELTGLAGRVGGGLKAAAGFTAVLAAVDLLGMGAAKLINKSDKAKKFNDEHRLLSFGAIVAAAFGTVFALNKGFAKLGKINAPKFLQKGTEKVAKFLNTNKNINKLSEKMSKLGAKTPITLKEIGATALNWAPSALLLGGFFNSIASGNNRSREFAKNYSELRELKDELTEIKLAELEAFEEV